MSPGSMRDGTGSFKNEVCFSNPIVSSTTNCRGAKLFFYAVGKSPSSCKTLGNDLRFQWYSLHIRECNIYQDTCPVHRLKGTPSVKTL